MKKTRVEKAGLQRKIDNGLRRLEKYAQGHEAEMLPRLMSVMHTWARLCWKPAIEECGYDFVRQAWADTERRDRLTDADKIAFQELGQWYAECCHIIAWVELEMKQAAAIGEDVSQAGCRAFFHAVRSISVLTRLVTIQVATPKTLRDNALMSLSGLAYTGISLRRAKRLRQKLGERFGNAYEGLKALLPDAITCIAADPSFLDFEKLPGAASTVLDTKLIPTEKKPRKIKALALKEEILSVPVASQREVEEFEEWDRLAPVFQVARLNENERFVLVRRLQKCTETEILEEINHRREQAGKSPITVGSVRKWFGRAKEKIKNTPDALGVLRVP